MTVGSNLHRLFAVGLRDTCTIRWRFCRSSCIIISSCSNCKLSLSEGCKWQWAERGSHLHMTLPSCAVTSVSRRESSLYNFRQTVNKRRGETRCTCHTHAVTAALTRIRYVERGPRAFLSAPLIRRDCWWWSSAWWGVQVVTGGAPYLEHTGSTVTPCAWLSAPGTAYKTYLAHCVSRREREGGRERDCMAAWHPQTRRVVQRPGLVPSFWSGFRIDGSVIERIYAWTWWFDEVDKMKTSSKLWYVDFCATDNVVQLYIVSSLSLNNAIFLCWLIR